MMRVAAAFAAVGVVEAHRASDTHKFLGSGAERMQPEVVAHSLSHMEDEWKAQATAFIECNATKDSSADDELSACARAPKAFQSSCSTVVNAVVKASSGEKASVSEYMGKICSEHELEGWHQARCQNLASVLLGHMTSSNEENRDDFDSQAVCHKLWAEVVSTEKVDAEKQAAEQAAELAEDAKHAAEEDAKLAEQRKQEAEERKASDAKEAQEKAVEQLNATEEKAEEKEEAAKDEKMAATEDAKAAEQKKEEEAKRADADAQMDQKAAEDRLKARANQTNATA